MRIPEDELIEALRRVLAGPDPRVEVGIGDDAAVVGSGPGSLVLTTDMLVDRVHFERSLLSARELGERALAVNVSDLAAMGASPRHALLALGLPEDVEAAWVVELASGLREAADAYALSVVGGDVNRSAVLTIAIAATGEVAPGRAVLRSGAAPGDRLVVTGSLGAAAGGLQLSRAAPSATGKALASEWGRELVRAYARPLARVGEGQLLARAGVTAMIDVSDGLAKDLGRLCAASGVGARVHLPAIPVAPELHRLAEVLTLDPLEAALSGGDDYELLGTMPSGSVDVARTELEEAFGVTLTEIGAIIEGAGMVAVVAEGGERPLEPRGWDHGGG